MERGSRPQRSPNVSPPETSRRGEGRGPRPEKSIPKPLCLHWGSVVRGLFKCLTVHTPEHAQLPPGSEMSRQMMPTNHLILCRPLLLLPSVFPIIRIFSNESALHIRWPKYWSFSFSISPSNEHPGLISFRIDWLDLLAVQGTLKHLLQHHSLEASIRLC